MGRKLSKRQGWLIGGAITGVVTAAVTIGATGVATASPAPAPATKAIASSTQTLKYDAKTLFRGVFFGHGAAAQIVAPYVDVPADSAAATATENKIMAAVERKTPGTIDAFYAAVASGSHVATRNALLRTSALVQDAMKATYGVDLTDEKTSSQGFVLAIPVAVAVVVWKYVKVYSISPGSSSSGLQMDGLVHALVTQAR